MGRPLKIAKAQLITLTDTDGTTEVVTVSENLANLNVIAGMPFIPASTVGGLTGGTTYYIQERLSNTTFTVSATQLSANPTGALVNLTTTSSQSVKLTVGLVDSGFSNPDGSNTATNSTTYGVVGGDTALYGSQVLAQVAIGINGTGTVYSLTSSADVWGINTDFANVSGLGAGSAIQTVTPFYGNVTNLGFVSSLYRFDATVTDTYANGYVEVDDNTGFNSNKPVYLQGNIGGLVANTAYFVTTIDGGGTLITLSLEPNGANVAVTADTGSVPVVAEALTLTTNATANSGGNGYGFFSDYIYANDEAGFILRQKGKNKYLVQGGTTGLIAQCTTANVANTALTPNTMSVTATTAAPATIYMQSINDYQSQQFVTTVAPGSLVVGTQYTIYFSGTTDWTAVGASGNMTGISFTATATGSGTGTAILTTANPDVIATFGTAYAANTYDGQPNPIVTVNNA